MSKIRILVADTTGNGHRKSMLRDELLNNGLDAEITIIGKDFDIQNKDTKFDIAFIDWLLYKSIDNISIDHICILSGSENIEVPKFALRNKHSFMYKPFNIKKLANLILNHANN